MSLHRLHQQSRLLLLAISVLLQHSCVLAHGSESTTMKEKQKKKQSSVPLIMTPSDITQCTGSAKYSVQCQKLTLCVSQYINFMPLNASSEKHFYTLYNISHPFWITMWFPILVPWYGKIFL